MPTVSVSLSTTEYIQVNSGFNPLMLQANRDSVRIVFNDTKPARSNSVFHTLDGSDPIKTVPWLDTNVWVLALTDRSSLTVTEVEPRDIDPSGSRIILTHEHAKIHQGEFFSVGYLDTAVIDEDSIEMMFSTPADMSIHMYIKLVGGGDALFSVYEGTNSVHGTSISSVNHNRTSANTCGCVISHTPTITTDGDELWTEFLAGGSGAGSGGGGGSGGAAHTPGAVQGVSAEQVVLDADTDYLFRLKNISNATNPLQITMAYYPAPI